MLFLDYSSLDLCIIADTLETGAVDQWSGPGDESNWEVTKDFISSLTVTLNRELDSLNLGILYGGTFTYLNDDGEFHVTPLQTITNIVDITRKIKSLKYPKTATGYFYANTKIVLSQSRTLCFGTTGDRPEVPNLIILVIGIVPRHDQNEIGSSAFTGLEMADFEKVHEAGINIMSVANLYVDVSFLRQLSLNGDDEDYFKAASIAEMPDLIQPVVNRAINFSKGKQSRMYLSKNLISLLGMAFLATSKVQIFFFSGTIVQFAPKNEIVVMQGTWRTKSPGFFLPGPIIIYNHNYTDQAKSRKYQGALFLQVPYLTTNIYLDTIMLFGMLDGCSLPKIFHTCPTSQQILWIL